MSTVDKRLDAALHALGRYGAAVVAVVIGERSVLIERTRAYLRLYGWREVRLDSTASPASQLQALGIEHIDVLHIETPGRDWPVLRAVDLERFGPRIVRLRATNLMRADLFAVVRHLERHGYAVEWFYDEVIGLLQRQSDSLAGRSMVPADLRRAAASVALYVISYNAPDQFRVWLESIEHSNPEILKDTTRFLLDNSTDPDTRAGYDQLCERYGFSPMRHGNLGISGGRAFCAAHFDSLPDAEALLWFEDDMLLHPPGGAACRNGLRTHVPDLLECCCMITRREGLDFLKLSFTELFGDHHLNWAWYNIGDDVREREFPGGSFRTRIDHTGVAAGVSYLVGEIHYSNWPLLMTRRGNARVFLEHDGGPPHEAVYMARSFDLQRRGELRAGVLLASPVNHCRRYGYPDEQRREY